MPKTMQSTSLMRLKWASAKATMPYTALKRVDFSKGLGPMLDKVEERWDAAADMDPLPDKVKTELVDLVKKYQTIAAKYRDQILAADTDDPGNGPTWMALHEALVKIDDGLVQDMKAIGVPVKKAGGWAQKSVFDRTAKLPAAGGSAEDAAEASAEYRRDGFETLAGRLQRSVGAEPLAFMKTLHIGLETSLGRDKALVQKLRRFTGELVGDVQVMQDAIDAGKAANARDMFKRMSDHAQQLFALLPPEGKGVKTAVLQVMQAMSGRLPPTA